MWKAIRYGYRAGSACEGSLCGNIPSRAVSAKKYPLSGGRLMPLHGAVQHDYPVTAKAFPCDDGLALAHAVYGTVSCVVKEWSQLAQLKCQLIAGVVHGYDYPWLYGVDYFQRLLIIHCVYAAYGYE